ncbi:auxin-induced protein 22E [Ricinus communis]|uniref:Auxin-responsive protein n=1 Tax=Ricinus communis TaxID=3988 RepID=B9S4S2_RICCO|nr:auxin-induced protein 22E [Ricinus communis]EEF41396.1 Auxin-induced protein 22E, putative [Ricinus communis]|eukprot:XP_002520979.1 auxin-induced protein 22E [Ricinus communis]
MAYHGDLNLKATELRLGLPGSDEPDQKQPTSSVTRGIKRASPELSEESRTRSNITSGSIVENDEEHCASPAKAQVVGWPPIRSYRKNYFQTKQSEGEGAGMYVKVSVDGAPYLRKIDIKVYNSYPELLKALENMFKLKIGEYSEREGYNGSDYAPTYEDKDGDWMLVGDVPWGMFISSCKRLRIVKGSEGRGLSCL